MSEPGQKLGEVLRAAREAKAVDVARVERETKIRARYVEALERGEYRELPGAVYTKGFLRNYGLYLGLDPEYLIDLYRLETRTPGIERPTVPTPPRPLRRGRRGFVVERNVVMAAILTMVVGALVVYLGIEFVTFARTPELRVIAPAGDIADWTENSYRVEGVTARNARVEIKGLRENPSVTADAEGRFEITVNLVPGSNVIDITAWDPQVSRTSETVSRTITVSGPEPSAAPAALELTAPTEGETVSGPIALAGTGPPGAALTITPVMVEAPPLTFSVRDPQTSAPISFEARGPVAVAPTTLSVAQDGTIAAELALPPGTWAIGVAGGEGAPLTRGVTVAPPAGLALQLEVGDGPSYVEIEIDGQPDPRSGTIIDAGTQLDLVAREQMRILAGNAGSVSATVNGIRLGPLGAPDAVVQWVITRNR